MILFVQPSTFKGCKICLKEIKTIVTLFVWSLGYQLNQGASIMKAYKWIKTKDSKRPASWISSNQSYGDLVLNCGESLGPQKKQTYYSL
jgi:hypothetical protein